ncbi:hypothetical protein Nstercoris_00568 [Nitrosomonas stercoris]|uniref:Lipoprotein n=1 Tax=Nitrosomonas stercoris TaxID=1444684 RepID=A0A4Y1YNE0_9PROT|nr:hypothetical protein Nstercoris_00568 [Nitrosomonas stercoris]
MKFTHLAIAATAILLVACDGGRSSTFMPESEKANYEKVIAGGTIECEHGLDGNGKCLEEGQSAIPEH